MRAILSSLLMLALTAGAFSQSRAVTVNPTTNVLLFPTEANFRSANGFLGLGLAEVSGDLGLDFSELTAVATIGGSDYVVCYVVGVGPRIITRTNLSAILGGGGGSGISDIDALTAVAESALDADDVLLISHDGTEKKIQTDDFQDYLESLSWTFDALNVTDLNATNLTIDGGAGPVTDAFGEFSTDNNAWAASRGAPQFFDGTGSVFLIGTPVGDTPTNGQVPTWNTGGTITWETPSGGAGSIATDDLWDAAGDLAVGSGANTAVRLPRGTALQILRVNAGETALEWAAPSAGSDADAIHDNVAGEIAAVADKAIPVAADHLLIEDSAAADAKKDITVGSQETALEGVMDLQDMQGAVTDGQIPAAITRDSEAAAAYQPLDSDLTTWAGITPGTGVGTALAVNVGTAGAFLVNGGALGTPASGDGTNLTNVPGTTGVYRTIYIDAGAMISRTTAGAATGTEELATNDIMVDYFAFDDTTAEGVQFKWAPPDEWDRGTVKVKLYWYSASATTSHTTVWGVKARAVSNDDALDGTWGTEVEVSDDVIAAGDLHVTAATGAITVGGSPALGDLVWFEIDQDAAEADHSGDAKLTGVAIQFLESSTEASAW